MPSYFSLDPRILPGYQLPAGTTIDQNERDNGSSALDNIPGSAKGAIPDDYTTVAKKVYPTYDGSLNLTTTNPTDQNFLPGMPPASDLPNFGNWHSAHQMQYLMTQNPQEHAVMSGTNTVAYFMLTEDNVPLNVLSLALSDFARLSYSDQQRVATISTANGFQILETLGLHVLTSSQKDDLFEAALNALTNTTLPGTDLFAEAVTNMNSSALTADDADVFFSQYTLLRNALDRSYAVAVDKVVAAINDINERMQRVEAFYSTSLTPPRAITITSSYEMERSIGYTGSDSSSAAFVHDRVSSLDGGETISKGYESFMAAERTILTMKNRREAIAESTTFKDPKLDLPNLIFKFQLLYEAEAEGIADSGTEEIRQLHRLLEDYSVMQRLINETIKTFDPGESSETRRFMNIGAKPDGSVDEDQAEVYKIAGSPTAFDNNAFDDNYGNEEDDATPRYHWSVLAQDTNAVSTMWRDFYNDLDPDKDAIIRHHPHEGDVEGKLDATELLAFSMFAEISWASGTNREHPIEKLLSSYTRPTFDFVTDDDDEGNGGSLELHPKTAFDTFQTSLSDAITILNQENQLKQNEIENATKRQNRHFELGNNALRKMNDLLLTIGRI